MHAIFQHSIIHNPDLVSYFFKPLSRFRFVAGEYTELYLAHNSPDDRGESRKFTIASSPSDPLIELVTTFSEPSSSFKRTLRALQPGSTVQLSETTGDFVLPKDPTIPIHFIGAGVGISPALSMVRWLQHRAETRRITIIHGASEPTAFLERNTLGRYAEHYTPILRHAQPDWAGATGTLSAMLAIARTTWESDDLWYLSGPEVLVDTLRAGLIEHGIAASQIVTDRFTGY